MISRYKWYKVRLPCSTSELLSKLKANGFDVETSVGFITSEVDLSFRYIWPSTINATRYDAEGNSEVQEFVTINSQNVVILVGERIVFRMENPLRSTKDLMIAIEKCVGFGFSCEQLLIKDDLVKTALKSAESSKVNSLKLSGAIEGTRTLARLELASKDGIDLKEVEAFGFRQYVVEAASYEVAYRGLKGQVGYSRTGLCRLSGALAPFILGSLESCLTKRDFS